MNTFNLDPTKAFIQFECKFPKFISKNGKAEKLTREFRCLLATLKFIKWLKKIVNLFVQCIHWI